MNLSEIPGDLSMLIVCISSFAIFGVSLWIMAAPEKSKRDVIVVIILAILYSIVPFDYYLNARPAIKSMVESLARIEDKEVVERSMERRMLELQSRLRHIETHSEEIELKIRKGREGS